MHRALALALAAALSLAPRADACTSAGGIALDAPPNHATAVPTDVELRFVNTFDPTRVPVLEGPDGVAVAVTTRPLEGARSDNAAFVMRPAAPLRPRTRYTFREPLGNATWTFDTGDGPLLDTPAVIRIDAAVAVDNLLGRGSCGYDSFACVGLAYRGVVDVTFRRRCDGAPIDRYVTRTNDDGLLLGYTGWAAHEPFCAELRARLANGALGPAATFCTDPAATPVVASNCQLTCRGGSAFIDGNPVALPPDDRAPDRCLPPTWTRAQLAEARASFEQRRAQLDPSCLLPDGGRPPTDADAEAVDASAEAADAGADAAPSTATGTLRVESCGCRAAGGARAKGGWALALIVLSMRRRSKRREASRLNPPIDRARETRASPRSPRGRPC